MLVSSPKKDKKYFSLCNVFNWIPNRQMALSH